MVVNDRLAWWRAGFDEMFALIAGRFAQVRSRQRARLYLLGLLSGADARTHGRPRASWADDRDRCAEAGIGGDVPFAPKPELAQRMLARLVDADAVGWFTADEAYGDNPGLQTWLEDQQID